jgi:site-specific recombinase XerD
MALSLYRRHRRDCKSGHVEDSRSGEFDERKKGWRRCDCPIFVSGTLARKFHRESTGHWEWSDAKAVLAHWEKNGSWDYRRVHIEPPSATDSNEPRPIMIVDATDAFIASCTNRGIAEPTLKKYKTFTKQLKAFCELRGYVNLVQLTTGDMDRFYASWKDGKRARAKKLERLKAFVKFCLKRKWLTEDIAEDLKAPEGSSLPANKTPFTDKELDRIFAACDAVGPPTPPGPGHRSWSGEDVKDFVYLSMYTGMRISDVATFDVSKRLNGNDVFLRMHKTQKELYTWIPDWLVHRMRDRQKKYGALIFRAGQSTSMTAMSERWRDNLRKVFKLAGPFAEKPHHHRFRHTFARILLQKGVPIADVAELIGDKEEVVRRHYARWVPERQERLTNILKDAFADKPKPKLVVVLDRGR